MAAALTVLLIGCLLQSEFKGALCGRFEVIMPRAIEVLSGSCVTIPCSFDVEDIYYSHLDETCRALWKHDERTVVFNSSTPQSSTIQGELKGVLKRKDCTTTLNNMRPEHSKEYYLRVKCDRFKHSFLGQKLHISVTDVPPTPTLTLSTLQVEEGTSVSLKCSAPAPCLSHPPALTWTSSLGHIQESLQENQDGTNVKISVLTLTASHLHHRPQISCTAVYNKQDGTSLTADVSWSAQFINFMPQTIEVLSGSCVTIPCFFDVTDGYKSNLDETCRALWKNDQETVVFDSRNPQTTGHLTGNLKNRDCTTTLNNMRPENSNKYYFRLHCDGVKFDFKQRKLEISVKDVPPTPTLTPSTLQVEEGTSVSLKCSAPAPCLSHPPALTWTSSLGHIQESLQENQDRTKVKTSVLTFTASHLHHRLEISCTAVYNKQDGSTQSVSTSLTADISFAPQILSSYVCSQTADQLNCSCETVGNPPPALQWYLDGLPVNHSDRFAISNEPLNITGLMSIITVSQPQRRDLSTLLCHSSNSLGSTTQRFFLYSLEPHGVEQYLGPYSGLLLLAVAGVSLCVNVLFAIYVVFLCKARKSVKPKEEDRTYMSLERRDTSPVYDVIG